MSMIDCDALPKRCFFWIQHAQESTTVAMIFRGDYVYSKVRVRDDFPRKVWAVGRSPRDFFVETFPSTHLAAFELSPSSTKSCSKIVRGECREHRRQSPFKGCVILRVTLASCPKYPVATANSCSRSLQLFSARHQRSWANTWRSVVCFCPESMPLGS